MFGKVNAENLVKHKKWDKLRNVAAKADVKTAMDIAVQCGKNPCDETYNILVNMLEHPDKQVVSAAILALGESGVVTGATHIRRIMNKYKDDQAMQETIHTALRALKGDE